MEHVFSASAQQSAKAMEHAHTKLEEIKRRLCVCEGNSESFAEVERKLAPGFASQRHIATIHRRINDVEKSLGEVKSECKTEFVDYHEAIAYRLSDTAESLRGQIEHESSRLCVTVLTSVKTLVEELQDRFETEKAFREAEAVVVRTCLGAEKSSRRADIWQNLINDEISKSLSAGILSSKEARRLRNDIDGHMNQLSSQIDGMNSDAKERITVKIPNPDAGGGPPGGGANNLDPRLASPLASPPAGMRVLAIQPTRPCRWPSPCIASPVSSVPAQPSIKGGADRRAKAVDPTMSPPVPLDPSACVAPPPCQQQQPSRLRSNQPLVRQGSLSPSSRMTH
jgi:hypothetical protein